MSDSKSNRIAMLEAMASFVLVHGLNAATLRPMAKAAGTSDRMLLYHFGSKDQLISELLLFLASDLASKLDLSLPPYRAASVQACVTEVVAVLRRDPVRAYTRIWLEIVAVASGGCVSHARIGGEVIAFYGTWLRKRLPEDTADIARTIALVLTMIEGTMIMDAVGRSELADTARQQVFSK